MCTIYKWGLLLSAILESSHTINLTLSDVYFQPFNTVMPKGIQREDRCPKLADWHWWKDQTVMLDVKMHWNDQKPVLRRQR